MGLDNIRLSPSLLQQLYKKVLVNSSTPEQVKSIETAADPIAVLGTNDKNIVIIVNEKDAVFLPEKDMALLTGIISACDLSMADVAMVNFAKTNIDYDLVINRFSPRFTIMFGIAPSDLGFPLQFPMYQLQKYTDRSFLYSAPLNVLAADVQQKKQLWNCLQRYFFNQ